MEDLDYYKLGKLASSFYDPNQPENKTLLPGQVLPLKDTLKVREWVAGRGLEKASAKEYEASQKKEKKLEEEREAARAASTPKGLAQQLGVILQGSKGGSKKEAELAKKDEELAQKEAELTQREEELTQREEELAQKEAELGTPGQGESQQGTASKKSSSSSSGDDKKTTK